MAISLMWDNAPFSDKDGLRNDLDLHLVYTDENGFKKYVYYQKKQNFGAELDVDRTEETCQEKCVENIIVPDAAKGKYQIIVHNYAATKSVYDHNDDYYSYVEAGETIDYPDDVDLTKYVKKFTVVDEVFGQKEVFRKEMQGVVGKGMIIKTFEYEPRN